MTPERIWAQALKRTLDILVAIVVLIVVAPVMAVLVVVVHTASPGPIIFRQTRIGRGGQTFTLLKFRTMFVGSDARVLSLSGMNHMADGPLFKVRDDPRVTVSGRWMRKYSLDELPQLFNVLAGSMSLVGPRPALPHETETYSDNVRRRLTVKPGITGLWQVSGRCDLDWAQSVQLDIRYVETWNIYVDIWILIRTIPAVISGRGAY